MISRFAAWHLLLLCILLSLATAARAQQDTTIVNLPPGAQAGASSLDASARSAEQPSSTPAEMNPSAARELSPGDAREDLTAFFSIGIAIDVLLFTLFAAWAVGQWRKPRK